MDNKFLETFNEKTENKFSYLRLDSVDMQKNEKLNNISLHITFIVPYEIYNDPEQFNNDVKAEIENAVLEIVPKNVVCHVKYDKVKIMPEVILRHVTDYIRENYFKLFNGKYIPKDITIDIKGDVVHINIPVDERIKYFCENKGVLEKLTEFLDSKYSAKNFVKFTGVKIPEEDDFKLNEAQRIIDDGIVNIKKGLPIVGENTPYPPIYISKYTAPQKEATVCGYVLNIEKKVAKSNRVFYIFDIKDPTNAVMRCLYFLRLKSTKSKGMDSIKPGQDLVVTGEIVEDNYSHSLSMFARSIASCIIDVEGTQKKIHFMKKQVEKMNVPEPKPYEDEEQKKTYSLFDEVPYICPLLRDKEFTVYDLETTAQSRDAAQKIIEIGAVKVKNGEIVSTFQTLVDPEEPISYLSVNLTHITDAMVENAPIIRDAIGPFIKYALNTTVVGQNIISFDTPIVKENAKKYGYEFDNEQIDTLNLARKGIADMKRHSLADLCEYFNVVNETPHRALSDALATAKVFIKLANLLKLE